MEENVASGFVVSCIWLVVKSILSTAALVLGIRFLEYADKKHLEGRLNRRTEFVRKSELYKHYKGMNGTHQKILTGIVTLPLVGIGLCVGYAVVHRWVTGKKAPGQNLPISKPATGDQPVDHAEAGQSDQSGQDSATVPYPETA